jgi:hypothetical protein
MANRSIQLTFVLLTAIVVTLNSCQEFSKQPEKLERPFIWVKASERDEILKKIEDNDWAKELFESLQSRAGKTTSSGMIARREKIMVLPLVWSEDSSKAPTIKRFSTDTPHDRSWKKAKGIAETGKALDEAIDNAVLYYLTEEPEYAKAAGDILATFVNAIAQMEIVEGYAGNRGLIIQEDHLYGCRLVGAKIPIIYDFIYPWFKSGGQVYDVANNDLRPFDFEAAQATFRTYISLAKNSGHLGSNWSVLESPSLVGNILALDDEKERNEQLPYYLNKDTERQESLATVAKRFVNPGDIWPESISYSTHVANLSTYLMTILDGVYPDLELGNKYANIPEALNVYYHLQFPNGEYPGFGDSKRNIYLDYMSYEAALRMAKLNHNESQIKTLSKFLAYSIDKGHYKRDKLGNHSSAALKLLWANENLGNGEEMVEPERDRTNHVPHAGLYVQRNISSEGKIKNSLMATLSGGGYVHGHASGIDMELYGQGYVLGTESGMATYGTAIHENYYKIFAAHNTVISNGASASDGPWVNLGIETIKAVAIEPKPFEEAASPNHSFVMVEFLDKHNLIKQADHQRTLALIKLSETHGYYLDIFRAKSDTSTQYHDYMYHNAGDQLDISSMGSPLSLSEDSQRYQASGKIVWDRQEVYQHPGWHYFEEVKSSKATEETMEAIFTANQLGEKPIYMRGLIPSGLETEITKVMAPKSFCAPQPYDTLPIPTFILRHKGETWKNPFAVIYESYNDEPVVQSVERLMSGEIFKGVKVISKVEGKIIIQYIIQQENIEDEYSNKDLDLSFKGRFGLITLDDNNNLKELYIGNGIQLTYKQESLKADETSHSAYLEM